MLLQFLLLGIIFAWRRFLSCFIPIKKIGRSCLILSALLVDAFHSFHFPLVPLSHSFIDLAVFFHVPRLGKPILRGLV